LNYTIEAQKIRNFPPPPLPVIQGIIAAPEKVDLPRTTKVSLNQTKSIALLGENFLEDCVVAVIPHGENDLNAAKIIEHKLIGSTEIRLDFYGGKEGTFDLLINTDKEVTTRLEKAIEVKFSPWIDFRNGGSEVSKSDFKMTAGLDIKRNSQGLYFKGNKNNWKWGALYLPLLHSRKEKNTYEIIFYHTAGIHMVGVGRENFNAKSGSQIYQAEIVGYFSSSTHFNRFYGNGGNYYVGKNVTRNKFKKLILENKYISVKEVRNRFIQLYSESLIHEHLDTLTI